MIITFVSDHVVVPSLCDISAQICKPSFFPPVKFLRGVGVRFGDERLERFKGFVRRIKAAHPAHPCVHGMRHDCVCLRKINIHGHNAAFVRPRGNRSEQTHKSLLPHAHVHAEHSLAVKAGRAVVFAVLFLYGRTYTPRLSRPPGL